MQDESLDRMSNTAQAAYLLGAYVEKASTGRDRMCGGPPTIAPAPPHSKGNDTYAKDLASALYVTMRRSMLLVVLLR